MLFLWLCSLQDCPGVCVVHSDLALSVRFSWQLCSCLTVAGREKSFTCKGLSGPCAPKESDILLKGEKRQRAGKRKWELVGKIP